MCLYYAIIYCFLPQIYNSTHSSFSLILQPACPLILSLQEQQGKAGAISAQSSLRHTFQVRNVLPLSHILLLFPHHSKL